MKHMVDDVRSRRGLVHPLPLASVALLLLNDHVLKRACPSWLTGKLSDFAGLFFFPLLLVAVAELSDQLRRRRRLVASIACVATAGVFAAIKVSPACNALANHFGTFVFDPTDVVALASVAAAWFFAVDRPRPSPGVARWQTGLAIVVASGAGVATSRPPTEPTYPKWIVVDGGPTELGCAHVDAWIPKSGRTGFGLTIEIDVPSGCSPSVSATFRAGDVSLASARVTPEGGERRFAYLPFAFDNVALFDGHVEDGEIIVTVDDGQARTRVFKVQQRAVPAFGRYAARATPVALRGPSSMMTSCGPVHARAELAGGEFGPPRLRVVFTVAPRCHVEATAVLITDAGREPARVGTKEGGGGVDGDFWVELRQNARGRLDVELRDGGRILPWAIDVDTQAVGESVQRGP